MVLHPAFGRQAVVVPAHRESPIPGRGAVEAVDPLFFPPAYPGVLQAINGKACRQAVLALGTTPATPGGSAGPG